MVFLQPVLILLLLYYALELLTTRRLVKEFAKLPLIYRPSLFTPNSVLNLGFAFKGARVIEDGYKKVIIR